MRDFHYIHRPFAHSDFRRKATRASSRSHGNHVDEEEQVDEDDGDGDENSMGHQSGEGDEGLGSLDVNRYGAKEYVDQRQPSDEPDSSISAKLRDLRLRVVNWSENWGSETCWDRVFDEEIALAEYDEGRMGVFRFIERCEGHVEQGRQLLTDLKFVASGCGVHSGFEVVDMFLQGYELVKLVATEVKFFEVKLDQYPSNVIKKFVFEVARPSAS